jgi:hypothetical protein
MGVEPQICSHISYQLNAENFIRVQLVSRTYSINHRIIKPFEIMMPNKHKFSTIIRQELGQLLEEEFQVVINFRLSVGHFPHLANAAILAISERSSLVSFLARAFEPA